MARTKRVSQKRPNSRARQGSRPSRIPRLRDAKRSRSGGRTGRGQKSSTKKKSPRNAKRGTDENTGRFGFISRLIFMMALGFLMVWTYDLVTRTVNENEQMDELWDKVVMRFLDEDLPGFPKEVAKEKPAQKTKPKAEKKAAVKKTTTSSRAHAAPPPRPVPTTGNDLAPKQETMRGDLPDLSPEEYARQNRLRAASSTKAERAERQEAMRGYEQAVRPRKTASREAPSKGEQKVQAAGPQAAQTEAAQKEAAQKDPVQQRVARTRQALNAIIQSVTGQ